MNSIHLYTKECDLLNEGISILQKVNDCANLDLDVSELIEQMKIKEVQQKHQFSITSPTTPQGRWMTYVKNENGTRVKITSTTEKGLYEKLFDFYFEDESTISSIYPIWLEKRKTEGVKALTIRRNQNHWDKYYTNNPIVNVPLSKLDAEMIEHFLYEVIKEFNITSKELCNMKFILSDILKMAKRKKLITYNPMLDVEVKTNGCKPPSKLNDSSRVYLPGEKQKLFEALNEEIQEYPNRTDAYAVFLLFKLGLRIGEICALKWSDIDFDAMELHIHRIESREADANGRLQCCIEEHTKKKSLSGDRFLVIEKYELDIFNAVSKINSCYGYSDNDFIFCDENGRTKIREIDNLIRKCCRKKGIEEKSAHDIRRTVASEMFNNHVPVELIRDYLGHSDIKTTYGYILDNNTKAETRRIIVNSLENLNGLKRTQIG